MKNIKVALIGTPNVGKSTIIILLLIIMSILEIGQVKLLELVVESVFMKELLILFMICQELIL